MELKTVQCPAEALIDGNGHKKLIPACFLEQALYSWQSKRAAKQMGQKEYSLVS